MERGYSFFDLKRLPLPLGEYINSVEMKKKILS